MKGAKVQDVTLPQTFPIADESEVLGVPIEDQGMTDREMLEVSIFFFSFLIPNCQNTHPFPV